MRVPLSQIQEISSSFSTWPNPRMARKIFKLWLFLFLRGKFDVVYSFFYSLENIRFASWVATQKKCKHIVHIADHSSSFFNSQEIKSILK